MCEGSSRLAQFNRLRSGHIGCGSDACRLLMINEFHHCHSETTVTKTEAVCQLNLFTSPQNHLKICYKAKKRDWVVVGLKNNAHC